MPLYEYECTACRRRTEKIQKFSDPELTQCPHCGGRLERTLTAPAVQFKGGGWYKDLYSSAKPAAANAGDAAKPADGAKPAESSAPAASASGSSDSSSSAASSSPGSSPPATTASKN
jgi:putative FmdB family regulatory protein